MAADSSAPQTRGWYYGWNIVAVTILSQVAVNGLTYNAFSLFLGDWSAELQAPISELQLSVAAMVLFAALVSPAVGILVDKYPARRIFACGILGMAAFYLAISVTTSAWQILALYGLMAPLALVLSTATPSNALITRWFVRRRGLALGLSAFGIGMAGVLLPPIVAVALPSIGWRLIWRFGGLLLALVVTPIVVFTIRDRPTQRDGLHYLDGAGDGRNLHGRAAATATQLSWRDVVTRRNFVLLVAIYLPMLGLYGGCAQNLAPYVTSHGWSAQSAGGLISVMSFAHLVATLVLGLVSDRFGNRLPFAGLGLIMAAGAAILAWADSLWLVTVACALIGFGGGLYTLLAAALAAEFGAEGFGRAYGLTMLFLPIMSLTPFAIAKIQESTGSYTPPLLGLALLVLCSGALSLLLRERRGGYLTEAEIGAAEDAVSPLI